MSDGGEKTSTETKRFVSGLLSGVIVAGLLNPLDRALYLTVRERRKFLTKANFTSPYAGFGQTIVHRVISGGLYFPLYDATLDVVDKYEFRSDVFSRWLSGTIAGAINAFVLNPLSIAKYHAWGTEKHWAAAVAHLYGRGGLVSYFRGINATLARDMVWGGTFAMVNFSLTPPTGEQGVQRKYSVYGSLVAGVTATVLSSPFNFVRNIHFATHPRQPVRPALEILSRLKRHAFESEAPFRYLQMRLCLGWGTARVGVGMALTATLYEGLQDIIFDAVPSA